MESKGSKTDTHPKFFFKNAFFLLSDQNQQAIRFTNGALKKEFAYGFIWVWNACSPNLGP